MEVKAYNKKELREFIFSEQFSALKNIPISKHRAISQINNPRASDEDILLIVQYDTDKVVGYIGILPDYVFVGNNQEKIGWFSCFWVDEQYKTKNVAANLFLRAIRACNHNVFITNIVPWLEPVYQKTKIFQPTIYKSGFRGYLRFNFFEILPPKKRLFQKVITPLSIFDSFLNFVNHFRLLFYKRSALKGFKYEYINQLDDNSISFIDQLKKQYWNQRGASEISWIINNPWIIQGANKDYNSSRYYFSSLNKRFFHQIVKFTNEDNQIVAILVICIRDNNITIPYVFSNCDCYETICRFLINTMFELKLSMLTTFDPHISKKFETIRTPFFFSKKIMKPYLISKKSEFIKELNFQDGDGDCAFY